MKKLVALSFLYNISCNTDKSNTDKQAILTDIRQDRAPSVDLNMNMQGYKSLNNKNELIGVWASDNKEPLTLEINADSIYYTEHFESHKYRVKEDSIFISYPDFVFSAKVYFHNDTLVMESEDGKSKYHKFKE